MGFVKSLPLPYFESFNSFFEGYTLQEFMDFMINGAVRDGLIKTDKPQNGKDYYTVALFFKDHPHNFDLHWYRFDDDGTWSHKNGWQLVTNKDSNGKIIIDVTIPPDPFFPVFDAYFLVPREGIVLTKEFPHAAP
jgi:hypothetical protein